MIGYPKYFGLCQIRFGFFRYQDLNPGWKLNIFWSRIGTTFSDRIRFGLSNPEFFPSVIIYIKYHKKNAFYIKFKNNNYYFYTKIEYIIVNFLFFCIIRNARRKSCVRKRGFQQRFCV